MNLVLRASKLPLTDGTIRLRLPAKGDLAALAHYAGSPGELAGGWLPVTPGSSHERLEWVIEDWLRAWGGGESHNGPALLLDVDSSSRFVGYVGFGVRDSDAVELVYGVAPDWRGRGLATRAASLATRWLIAEQRVRTIELRVPRAHRESQRVAERSGFRLAGTVRQRVAGTGETFEDLRYTYGAEGRSAATSSTEPAGRRSRSR